MTAIDRAKRLSLQGTVNYVTMLDRMSDMQIQQSTLLALQLTPPDIVATMPQYAFNTFDFDKAETIISNVDCGRWKFVSIQSQTLNS